jgi:hypothetical protein
MCKPDKNAKHGSLHILERQGKQQELLWFNAGWAHVGGNCTTIPEVMKQYGWKYISPSPNSQDS